MAKVKAGRPLWAMAVIQVRDDEMGMTIGDRCKSNLGYRISRRSWA